MSRRALVLTVLASLAAAPAFAQVTSETLDSPPGQPGGYDAYQPYGNDAQGGPPPAADEQYEGNPYADPAAGGTYDPATGTTRPPPPTSSSAPVPLTGPGGAQPYGYGAPDRPPVPPGAQPYGQQNHGQQGYGQDRGAPPPAYGQQPGYGAPGAGAQTSVGSSCDRIAAELQRFRGPAGNPMQARDEACISARGSGEPGRPNAAFRQCSDEFFRQYEAKRNEYQACMAQDDTSGQQRLEQRETTVEAARSGYGGTAPQPTGKFARAGAPGWLGVQVQPVTPQAAYRLGAEGTEGVLVTHAVMGSPAQKAGMQRGDIIVALDGEPIARPRDLQYHAERLSAGQTVRMEVLRGGQRQMLTLEITQRP